jgi:hypothetical protein
MELYLEIRKNRSLWVFLCPYQKQVYHCKVLVLGNAYSVFTRWYPDLNDSTGPTSLKTSINCSSVQSNGIFPTNYKLETLMGIRIILCNAKR